MDNKTGGYISKMTFNSMDSIELSPNDIVVFVGPNNAGKSQSLKDIFELAKEKKPTVVISDIEIIKYDNPIKQLLDRISTEDNKGSFSQYNVLGHLVSLMNKMDSFHLKDTQFGDFRDVIIVNMDTETRLSISNPPVNIKRDASKLHPIHYAAYDSMYRKWLSNSFKKAFNAELIPNTQFGSQIPLCIGESVHLEQKEYEDAQAYLEAYASILEKYRQVQNQGDGIRSFTGILLYLMLDYYCIYLIDEPESFLHPPQARIMGQIIGNTLSKQQQAFISTHSEEIIKGLLETCPERLKIIRITREDDTNYFSVLTNESFSQIWTDPLLKHSNIMSSLFHKTVVLCESDSDCQMYSIIENYIKQSEGKYSEALFIHCGGKHRMKKIIKALKSLNVNIKVVTDIDVLDDENVFKEIVEAFSVDWNLIEKGYKIIVSSLHKPSTDIERMTTQKDIDSIFEKSKDKFLLLPQ